MGRTRPAVAQFERLIAVVLGLDLGVFHPGFPLGDLLLEEGRFGRDLGPSSAGSRSRLSSLLAIGRRPSSVAVDALPLAAGQRRLPAVAARQIAAVPLGANVVQLAEQAPPDQVARRCRTARCSAADDRPPDRGLSCSANRPITLHWATLWAISFSVSTCLPACIASIATGACRVQRQGDDHRFDLRVLEQVVVVAS